MPDDSAAFAETLDNLTSALLRARNPAGYWEGHLSSSALSTATAVFALGTYERAVTGIDAVRRDHIRQRVRQGLDWICANQNADGGWGDTLLSISNISTTALCWAALALGGDDGPSASGPHPSPRPEGREQKPAGDPRLEAPANREHVLSAVVRKAEAWLAHAAGSLDPAQLAAAIRARYGKDQTFSVPILTMCALAGRLGDKPWRFVPQLPFELAACPYQWFQWLSLRVVSYALPALIAMGQVRHARRPTRNPLARLLRHLTRGRTLRVLQQIQPTNGGFLEATPLTSFVTMSLVGCGQSRHPVTARGVDFLVESMRDDGSWPIDTNLATWVTTLSVNALATGGRLEQILPLADRTKLRDWLLAQQYRVEHPYTHADPGAWAWTDLPGGVPDADDTAGALLALWNLGLRDAQVSDAAQAGVNWLLDLQNRDGGIPTFCRGWGKLPFDRSGCDLTAHALHAWAVWRPSLPTELQLRLDKAIDRARAFLRRQQRPDGAWVPLWFGNQFAPDDENPTYGTARVLTALCAIDAAASHTSDPMIVNAVAWVLKAQNPDGGWGGATRTRSSIEETALAVRALALHLHGPNDVSPQTPATGTSASDHDCQITTAMLHGLDWLQTQTKTGSHFPPAPIGFYFAKLWYFERSYPSIFCYAATASSVSLLAEPCLKG